MLSCFLALLACERPTPLTQPSNPTAYAYPETHMGLEVGDLIANLEENDTISEAWLLAFISARQANARQKTAIRLDTAGLWFEGQDNYTNLPKLKYVFGQNLENAFGQDIDLTIEETETGDTVVFVELANRQRYFRVPHLSKVGISVYELDTTIFERLKIYSLRPAPDSKSCLLLIETEQVGYFFAKYDEKKWRLVNSLAAGGEGVDCYSWQHSILVATGEVGQRFFRWEDKSKTFLEFSYQDMNVNKKGNCTQKTNKKSNNPFSVFNDAFYPYCYSSAKFKSKDTLLLYYYWGFSIQFDVAQCEQPFEFLGINLHPKASPESWVINTHYSEAHESSEICGWRFPGEALDSLTAVWAWDNALHKYVCVQITEPVNFYSQNLREILTNAPVFGKIESDYFEKIALPDYATLLKKYPNFKPNISNTETPEQALGWKLLKGNKLRY